MAYAVEWSPRAVEDVRTLARFIAADSEAYAATVVKKIVAATRSLETFPRAGRIVPEFGDENLREKFAYNYRIIYRVQGQTVTIAAVVHGKRPIELEF